MAAMHFGYVNILITNDDGIEFPAVLALREALSALGHVSLFAPAMERSATSQAMTIYEDIYVRKIEEDTFIVNGYPVDCTNIALHGGVTERKFDLVVSGINKGPNLGEDIWYSGTLGAARHAYIHGLPAIAVSTGLLDKNDDYAPVANFMRKFIEESFEQLPKPFLLNINYPPGIKVPETVKWTKPGLRIYRDKYKKTPIGPEEHGAYLFNLGGSELDYKETEGADFEAYYQGYVSVSPLNNDVTDHERFKSYFEQPKARVATRPAK